MTETNSTDTHVPIPVPPEAAEMSPKQIILLMRSLGVGKPNYAPPRHARAWTTTEFLEACTRDDVIHHARGLPPERSTVEGWFSESGPIPNDGRGAFHYFFHIFFSESLRLFGTREWKKAYFASIDRMKINAIRRRGRERKEILLESLDGIPIRQMTRPGPDSRRTPVILAAEQHMLGRDEQSCLGTILLLNSARRCFLRLRDISAPREPDWRAMAESLTGTVLTQRSLLAPERQLPCVQLCVDLDLPQDVVARDYTKAFHIELDADLGTYLDYLKEHEIDDVVLGALSSRCELERMRALLEGLATPPLSAVRMGGHSTR